jgi:hypothetical protein
MNGHKLSCKPGKLLERKPASWQVVPVEGIQPAQHSIAQHSTAQHIDSPIVKSAGKGPAQDPVSANVPVAPAAAHAPFTERRHAGWRRQGR